MPFSKLLVDLSDVRIILGNSNKRFSGVTSTMLQVLSVMESRVSIAVLGRHHLPQKTRRITFWQAAFALYRPLANGKWRLFHARRNDEMIQALILKYFFRSKIKIIFTSTAQRKKSWLTRALMAQMDGLVTTCSAAAKYMHIPPDVVIPHGIDLSFFEGDDSINLSERYGFKFGIGLFGRVRSQKGVDLLVDAALDVLPKSPDWGVLIVGEITPDQEAFVSGLKDKITNAGLDKRILFLGKQSFDALPLLFRSVDIVCALSKNEGFGLTVLEAGASSKPVVATKAGAWPDILSLSDFGYLIDVGDKLALVESLTDLASNPDVRLEMGIRGRACIEDKYSVQREASELLNYYESVINGSN